MSGPRRKMFFDLADPEKRVAADITRALDLIHKIPDQVRRHSRTQ